MYLDLYSYGRSARGELSTTTRTRDEHEKTFVCASCGCSAAARDPALILNIGWRLLPERSGEYERLALCPRCTRRSMASLI